MIRWWAVILFTVIHLLGAFFVVRGAEHKDFFEMLLGIIILFSPIELYPKMYKKHYFCEKHKWNFESVPCQYCKYKIEVKTNKGTKTEGE